jgi:hypothetical protein
MTVALENYKVAGVSTNIDFLHRTVRHPAFAKGSTGPPPPPPGGGDGEKIAGGGGGLGG